VEVSRHVHNLKKSKINAKEGGPNCERSKKEGERLHGWETQTKEGLQG